MYIETGISFPINATRTGHSDCRHYAACWGELPDRAQSKNVQELAQKVEFPRRSAAQNATSHSSQGPDLLLPMSVPHFSATTTVGMPEFQLKSGFRAAMGRELSAEKKAKILAEVAPDSLRVSLS